MKNPDKQNNPNPSNSLMISKLKKLHYFRYRREILQAMLQLNKRWENLLPKIVKSTSTLKKTSKINFKKMRRFL